MKSISITTLNNYKNKAIHDKNIPNDILKIRLNCLIEAVDKEHIKDNCTYISYKFGNCIFEVKNNIISNIRWDDSKDEPTLKEIKRMIFLFNKYGLNQRGNKYLTKLKM